MSDFLIASDESRDLVFTEGRLTIVTGSAARAQRIRIALKHFRGEWFLDQNQGTDYFGKVLGKATDRARRAELRRRILGVPGVAEIQSIELAVDPKTRALHGAVVVLDGAGQLLEAEVGV